MKNYILTVCAIFLSILLTQAQEKIEEEKTIHQKVKLYVKLKDDAKPDIYVDGKKFNFRIELLDKDMIESFIIINGEKAIKKYNAPNGVILITTKKKNNLEDSNVKTKSNSDKSWKIPNLIIDGKISDKESLKKINPNQIDKIEIFKGEKALKEYNAPNGVIIVITKKKGKKR